jgi:hypothetical protein
VSARNSVLRVCGMFFRRALTENDVESMISAEWSDLLFLI